jgi:hypothetical protein
MGQQEEVALQGRAVQVEPMRHILKAPKTKRLRLQYDELLSNLDFNFNLRHYSKPAEEPVVGELAGDVEVGRCRLTLSNPC